MTEATIIKIHLPSFFRLIAFSLLMGWSLMSFGQVEICDNGIDDDFDNLIDLNDPDCFCQTVAPKSLIPNPSFEDMDCCPRDRSELHCASVWIQASEPTTDFIHLCDYLGWDDFPPPMPFPDGSGIMGFRDGRVRSGNNPDPFWKEYAGACLINPLLKDSTYRFQFDVGFVNSQKSPPIDISFFGTADCNNLPFGVGNEAFGCPSNSPDWKKLDEVRVSGGTGNKWVNSFIEFTPNEDIYAIAIGPDCQPVSTPISIYYFFDNLILADLEFFNLQVSEINHPCSNDYTFSVPLNPAFNYQWYLNGIALVGETSAELSQNYGEGNYQVRIMDGQKCRLSAGFEYKIPVFSSQELIRICEGDKYNFGGLDLSTPGVYIDTFLDQNGCDSIASIELDVIGDSYDTLEVSILDGETYTLRNYSFKEAGNYELTLQSSLGCDSLVYLKLETFNIYIPNSFTPNGDGVNDIFYLIAPNDEISSVEMQIADRWGNLIHKGPEWDGSKMNSGVYAYLINCNFKNGFSKFFHGDVTLLR